MSAKKAETKAPAPKKAAKAPVVEPEWDEEDVCGCGCEDDCDCDDDLDATIDDMADEAFMELLYDRVKGLMNKRFGEELDEVAESVVNAFALRREEMMDALAEEEEEERAKATKKPAKAPAKKK